MLSINGYVYAAETIWRKEHIFYGQTAYRLGYNLEQFVPFRHVFEAKLDRVARLQNDIKEGWIRRAFLAEMNLRVAFDPWDEQWIEKMGSLIVAVRRSGPFVSRDKWKFVGSGGNLLIHLKPYKRNEAALKALTRERSRFENVHGVTVHLASWKLKIVHPLKIPETKEY